MKPAELGQTESSPCAVGDVVSLHFLLRVDALSLVALEKALLLDPGTMEQRDALTAAGEVLRWKNLKYPSKYPIN